MNNVFLLTHKDRKAIGFSLIFCTRQEISTMSTKKIANGD